MKVRVLAVGTRLPEWMAAGVAQYAKRLPKNQGFEINEITAVRRDSGRKTGSRKSVGSDTATEREAERILSQLGPTEYVVALDEKGERMTTRALSEQLSAWLDRGERIAFLIGGPDGLHSRCLERAQRILSLSDFTLPHGLARVVLAEQLYRAWTLTNNHPYHRD